MSRGFLYLHVGDKYAVPLAVSIMTLRDWHDDPIAIVTERAGPGRDTAEAIASDSNRMIGAQERR